MKKNKKTIYVISLLAIFFTISSYLVSQNKIDDAWRFDSLSFTKKVDLHNRSSKDGMSLEIFMKYPDAASSNVDLRKIQNLISKIALDNDSIALNPKSLFARLIKQSEDLAVEYGKEWEDSGLEGLSFSTYELIRYVEANAVVDNSILVVSNLGYVFLGGAHGATTVLYSNINIDNYSIIKEHDLFKKGYKSKLAKLIQGAVQKRNSSPNEDDHIFLLVDLNSVQPNGNFYFTPNGLVYLYNQYEIAPYAQGQVEIKLQYKELLPLVKDDYLSLFNRLVQNSINESN